ncbi:MAG: adenylate/guanylate cyclase domain-containing response regulator [Rhodobacterales bacterium]|nr:adenylate/guanylate cyclase domain-containing response regulator [Rhodobacterales bacterium]
MKEALSILVVDDEPFGRNLLVRHLVNEGFTKVETADNGRQALDILAKEPYDLVLLDVEMPELDGISVLSEMKSDMRLRDSSVIMISGVDETDRVAECIQLGAEDYLSKPFNAVLLEARIGACLDRRRHREREKSQMEQLRMQKRRADQLLNVILPTAAASELKASGRVIPRRYDEVAVLFCDIVGFTAFCERHDAADVVADLQAVVKRFEDITDKHGMEKIKTIGDAFMATAGLMRPNDTPLMSATRCGLEMAQAIRELVPEWELRVGVHVGPVVAGIVGDDRYQFDLWGATVNTASRMSDLASPGGVAMTYDSWMSIEDGCKGRMLGAKDVKGIGRVDVIECFDAGDLENANAA